MHSVDRIKPVWNYLEDHLEDNLEQNHLACKKKNRFERRSLFNDQILTIDTRRGTTVIVIGVTVPANISRVTATLVGIHSIDTTTLEE